MQSCDLQVTGFKTRLCLCFMTKSKIKCTSQSQDFPKSAQIDHFGCNHLCLNVKAKFFDDLFFAHYSFFPGPQAFCKKAVERVKGLRKEKNILNSSVEWLF